MMDLNDQRPAVWVGHILLETDKLDASEAFMLKIGMRPIFKRHDIAVLELRGGTHLILRHTKQPVSGLAPFDLMVEDIEAAHHNFSAIGLSPTEIEPGAIHRCFYLSDPSGQRIKINSSHVSDLPV
jgi:hypothetical protein